MNLTTLKRSILLPVTAGVVGLATVSPSSADENNEGGGANEDLPVQGSANPDTDETDEEIDASADVNQLQQAETGGYTSLTWTLKNNERGRFTISDFSHETYTYGIKGMTEASGVALVDQESGTRYYPLKDDSETEVCLCSGTQRSAKFQGSVSDGEQATYWAAFSLPEDLSTVTVDIPKFEPIEDVQIE